MLSPLGDGPADTHLAAAALVLYVGSTMLCMLVPDLNAELQVKMYMDFGREGH